MDKEQELREMIEVNGMTQETAVKKFGVQHQTISKWCRKFGIRTQRTGPRSGASHPEWRGGIRIVGGYRYIYSPDHPNKTSFQTVAEHRLVMEKKLGRYLLRHEVVHHMDGNPLNNHPDNLVLFSHNSDHLKHELTGHCPKWSPEGKKKLLESAKKPKYFSPESRKKMSEKSKKQVRQRKSNGRFL